jgi:pimeloyl-ACP methyl ester carboxylesterase
MKRHTDKMVVRIAPLLLIASLPFVARADGLAAYKMYPNDVVNIQRWHLTEYNPEVQNVQYAASGQLPSGIAHVVVRTPTGYGAEWFGYLRGAVAAQGAVQLERYAHSVMVTYGVLSSTPSVTNVYPSLIRVDDYADEPGDTNHQVVLSIQTSWSESEGYSDGSLYPQAVWGGITFEPVDTDVFRIGAGAGVYCVETRCTQAGEPALDIAVLKKKADNNAYDGDPIAWTNDFNVYDARGQIDGMRQRVYCTLANDNGAFVRLTSSDPDAAVNYRIRVFRARPVILVHGIDSKPWTQAEARQGKNALGNWEDCLPWDALAYPCVCHNFSWDPREKHDDLLSTHVGKILGIIQQDPSEPDNPHIDKLYNKYSMSVVLIGHSMGGFIVRYALRLPSSREKIHKAVLLGSPMYGSDIALTLLNTKLAWWKNTSLNNLRALRRGSEFVNAMHNWSGANKCLCIAGKGAPPRARVPITPYERGLGYSDGVVPVSSALLPGAVNMSVVRDHGTVGLATYVTEETQYPFDPSPEFPGIGNSPDPCDKRRSTLRMFEDELYRTVRDHIR